MNEFRRNKLEAIRAQIRAAKGYFSGHPAIADELIERTWIEKIEFLLSIIDDPARTRGATGDYPDGIINKSDEGALNIRMGIDPSNGKFILDFGTKVTWIGMDKGQAIDFAKNILRHCVDRVIVGEIKDVGH